MKTLMYYIIPILIIIATLVGRIYFFEFCITNLEAFDWIFTKDPVSLKSILGTIILLLSVFSVLLYLIFIYLKCKKGKKYSFIKQCLHILAIGFFIEITLNGLFVTITLGAEGLLFVAYYLTYVITLPIALFFSYIYIGIISETSRTSQDEKEKLN